MKSFRLVVIGLLLLPLSAFAQTTENKNTSPAATTTRTKPAADPEAERILKERRAQAQSMLISLAADAGNYNDLTLRARTLARVADALWSADMERARTLFRKAWDAAEVVDREGQQRMLEDMRQQEAKGGSVAITGPPNIRGEVLRVAARRDRALGEELLGKLKVEKQQETTEASDKNRGDLPATPEAISQRLSLARQLLDADVERAIQFADPALVTLTREAIDFLSYLREKDAAAADRRFAFLLSGAGANLQSDANTVSLLASYLFTPHVFVTFSGGGASTTQTSRNAAGPPQTSTELRSAFFRVAGDILLRPLSPPGQDQTSAGVQGKYLMMKRLLPLFEQFAPRDLTEAMRDQIQALANAVPENARDRDDESLREGIRPPQSGEDREKKLLDQIDRAKTSAERDDLYLQLARLYTDKDDPRAREAVDKVEDMDLRKAAHAFFDAVLTIRAVDKKDPDRVLELVRTGELTHVQKSWALAQAAKLLLKTDRDKASATLEEATLEARRIDGSDADRPRALMAVANAWVLVDRERSWDAVYDAIKAANSAEGFTGEDGVLRIRLVTKSMASVRSSSAQDFDVTGIFSDMAKQDFNRTVDLARGFSREAPRATATIAIARTVLDDKKN